MLSTLRTLRRFIAFWMTAFIAFYQIGQPLSAATFVWDAGTGDAAITDGTGTWQVGVGNWFDGVNYDQVWTDGNDAVFGGGGDGTAGTVTLGGAISAGAMTFNAPFSGSYTIDTSTFSLTLSTGITANEDATIQGAIGGLVVLGADNIWDVADTKTLTVGADVGGAGFGIEKTGLGTLVLGGVGGYGGNTLITGGILRVANSNAFGAAGSVSLGDAILELADSVNVSRSLTILNGGNKVIQLQSGATAAEYTGSITILEATAGEFDVFADAGQAITLSGVISGSTDGRVNTTGAGTVILSGDNDFTSGVNVTLGTVRLTHGNAAGVGASVIVMQGTDTVLELGNGIAIDRALTISNTGNNKTLTLESTAVSAEYAGAITISETTAANFDVIAADGQTLTLSGDIAASAGANINFFGGGLLILSGDNNAFDKQVTLTGDGDSGTVRLTNSNALGSAAAVLMNGTNTVLELGDGAAIASALTISNTGNNKTLALEATATSAEYSGTILIQESSAANFDVLAEAGQTITLSGVISSSAAGRINATGGGIVILSGNNDFTSGVQITTASGGTVRLEHNNAAGVGAAVIVMAATNSVLELADGITIAQGLTISNTGNNKTLTLVTGATAAEYAGDITITETTTSYFDVVAADGQTFTLSGNIASSSGSALADVNVLGGGLLILSGADNSGLLTRLVITGDGDSGTVRATNNNSLGDSSAVVVMNGTGATLELADGVTIARGLTLGTGGNEKFLTLQAGALSAEYSGGITINETIANGFRVSPASGILTLSGVVTGTGGAGLTSQGAGTLVLTNAGNDYGGDTTVWGGTLQLGSSEVIPDASVVVITQGVLDINGRTETVGGLTLGADVTTVAGDTAAVMDVATGGLLILDGNLIYNAGSPGFNNGQASFSANLDLNGAARTFTIGDSDQTVFDLVISGNISSVAGSLVKAGAGTLLLSGTNNYGGGTAIQDGTVIAAGGINDRLGSGGLVLGNSGTSGVLQLGDSGGASDQTVTSLETSGFGTTNAIVGGNAGTSTLTVNQTTITTYNGSIGGAGNAGNLAFSKSGSGELTVNGSSIYTGATTVSGGGKLFLQGAVDGTPSLSVTGASVLSITGPMVSAAAVTSLIVDNGSTLRLVNGVGDKLSGLSSLTLGSSGGSLTTLGLNVGDSVSSGDQLNTDLLTLVGSLTLFAGNQVQFNLTDAGLNAGQQYDLISVAAGGLTSGSLADTDWLLGGTPGGFTSFTLTATDTLIYVTTGALVIGEWHWNAGGSLNNWDDVANWATDKTGVTARLTTPGQGSDVKFIADNINSGTNAPITTTLEQNFRINSLTFEASGNAADTPSSVTIDPGSLVSARLEIAPDADTKGIVLTSDGPGTVTINARFKVGANQTWNVANGKSLIFTNDIVGAVGSTTLTLNGDGTSDGTIILRSATGLASYAGPTNLEAGRLILEGGADFRLQFGTDLTLGSGGNSAVLQLGDAINGASNTIIGSLATSGSGSANAIVGGNAAVSTLTVTQGAAGTFAGVIGGTGDENSIALVKAGSSVLILDGANTYNGGTTVTNGVLQLGGNGSITGALAVSAAAGVTAAFDNNSRVTVLTGGITLGGADGSAAPVIANTGGGGSITLGGDVVYDATNNPLGGSIAALLDLGDSSRTFTVDDSASAAVDLLISGGIIAQASGTGLGITFTGTGVTTVTGNITLTPSGSNATSDITKIGSGTLNINGTANTNDDFIHNDGTVNVNSVLTVGDDYVADNGGTVVNLNVAGALPGTTATTSNGLYGRSGATININADDALGADMNFIILGDNNQGIGNLVMNANAAIDRLDIGSDSSGEQGFVTGSGTLTVKTILNLDNGTISANLAGDGNIDKENNQSVTLSGINSLTSASNTLIREGSLILDFSANAGTDNKIGTGALTLGTTVESDNRAVLNLVGNATSASKQTVDSIVVVGGPSEINLTSAGGQELNFVVVNGITRTGGTLNLSLPDANTMFDPGTTTNTNGIVGAWFILNDSDFASVSGSSIVAATYTTQNDASLWGFNENISNDAGFLGSVAAGCGTINSLRFNALAASTVTVGSSLRISSGGILESANVGANASLITGGVLISGTNEFIITQNNDNGTLTIDSRIIGGAAINKNGTGTAVLGGINNQTGVISIAEGILQLTGGSAISDTSQVNIRDNVANTGLQLLNNQTETIGTLDGAGSQSKIILNTGSTLTINQTGTTTFGGIISGAGTLVKNGAGVLTLTGNSTMTGAVIINAGGRLALSGGNGDLAQAASYTLNGGELRSVQDQSANEDRLGNAKAITLNNTAGGNGLTVENSYAPTTAGAGASLTETVGAITLGAGANVITAIPTRNSTSTAAQLLAASINQGGNHATLLVRGLNLGDSATIRKGMIRSTASIVQVGGGGAAVSTNISIVPWMVGQITNGGTGNSLVTYVDATIGLRPLDLTAEYIVDSTTLGGVLTDNIRYATSQTTTTPAAINALVLDSAAGAVVVTGDASAMEVTSGAILAAGDNANTITGFTDITTGGGSDYIFFTTGTGTLTVNSALSSAVALVKSGQGTLSLTNAGNAFTDVYLNEGAVLIDSLDKLNGITDALHFFGGGVQLTADFADDISSKPWDIGTGGGFLDVSLVTNGVVLSNGIDDVTAGSGDAFHLFTRSSASGSTGQLTIQGSSSFTGTVIVRNSGTNVITDANGVVLNGDTNAAINGNLEIGDLVNVNNNNDAVVALGASDQIVDTATITFRGASGENSYFKLLGFNETVAGIIDTSTRGVIENREGDTVSSSGTLTLNSSEDYSYNGYMRDVSSGTADPDNQLNLVKDGTGTQTLAGVQIRHSGTTTISGGTLQLLGVANWQSAIINNAALILDETADRTHAQDITGTGGLTKLGNTVLTLSGTNLGYTGSTYVQAGTLNVVGGDLATTALRVDAGATLNLFNGGGMALNLTSLTLCADDLAPVTLGLELGALSAFDRLITSADASTHGSVVLNLTGLTGLEAGDYDLITATGGLDGANYSIGSFATGGFSFSLSSTSTFVRLTTTALTGDMYWTGGISGSWSAVSGTSTNWATDLSGTANANGTPGAANSVIFSAQNATGPSISTTLDGMFTIKDLQFTSNPSGVTDITIGAGTGGVLTINPSLATAGISVADNAGAITVSADVALGVDQTWNVVGTGANGSSLTVSGAITGTANLTKTGAGTVILANDFNVYTGTTTISEGVFQAGIVNGFNNTSAHIINGTGILRLNDFNSVIASLAGSGTVENSGAGTGTLTVGDAASTVFSGTLQDGAGGILALTKVGTGTLELSGTSTAFSGNLTVSGGILKITGTIDNVAGGTGTADVNAGVSNNTTGVIYMGGTGSLTTDTISLGNTATRNGSLLIDGGSVTLTNVASGVVAGNGGYGYMGLQSGSLTAARLDANNNGGGTAVFRIDGGTATINEYIILRNLHSEFTVTGGQVLHNGASQNIALNYQNGGTSVMNIANATVDNTGKYVTFGQTNTSQTAGYTGILNLGSGGNLITERIVSTQRAGISSSTVNFNGGTLTASINEATFFNAAAGLTTYVYSGGAIIDTAGSNVTISAALEAPTGDGLTSLTSLTVSNAGSGYTGAPYVQITGDGTGATGYATVDLDPASVTFGQVTGVVITNPGIGYTTASVNLLGGGGSGAVIDNPTFAANVSGGLTKQGSGTLILAGNNTYTGGTTITGGTLALGVNDALASSGTVTLQGGGSFDLATFTNTVGQVTLEDGNISGTTGVLTSTADYDLRKGAVSGILAGGVGLNKTTADTVSLSGANTFSGAVSVTGGTLAFDAAANLGDASVTNTLFVNGATLSYTGVTTVTLSASQVLSMGTSGATLDVAFGAGTLELTGGITTAAAAALTKTGAGTVTVTGSTDLNGGAVTVSGGTLNAGFTATGISGVTVASGATLNLYDNTTLALDVATLSLASGSSLGFDLNASGVNDVINLSGSPDITSLVSLNFNNLGGMPTGATGIYDLINTTSGSFNAANFILGLAPSGFNYSFSTVNTDQTLRLTTTPLTLRYWVGDVDGSWSTNSGPGDTNWATDLAGTVDLGAPPGPGDTLVFSALNATGPTIITTLDDDFTVDSLRFSSNPASVTSLTINQGTSGVLTLAPISSNNGITVGGNAGTITIVAPLVVGADQTWGVVGTGANGSSLVVSGDVTFTASVIKTGEGVLTLGGANSGAGGLTLTGGTLNLASATAPGTGTLTINPGVTLDNTSGSALTLSNNNTLAVNGSFTFTGSDDLNLGTGALTLGNNAILSVAASQLIVGGNISDGGNNHVLTKAGAGTLALNGANTHGGGTILGAGTLNIGNASALGTGAFTVAAGGIFDNTSGGDLTLTGNVSQNWDGDFTFTGTNNLNLGTGLVALNSPLILNVAAGTLTVGGVIDDGVNANALTKTGAGTLVLTAANTYDGRTLIDEGTLKIGVNDALPTATVVRLGSGATAGTFDLGVFDQSIAGLISESTTGSVTNNLIINTGKTLTVNGEVVLGADAVSSSTKVVASGGGSLVINSGGSNFQVGGSTSTSNNNAADVDLSGLLNFTANLGLGTLKVGDVAAPSTTNLPTSDLRLATNNTITAGVIAIGEGTAPQNTGDPHSLILGSGTNIINANTILVGSGNSSNRARSSGEIVFDGADTTGTLKIRGSDGVSAALTLQMGNSTSTTGNSWTSTINLTGHAVDVLVNNINMARRTQGNGNATATLSVDQGVFAVNSGLVMAHRVTTGTGNATATLNIGGTATFSVSGNTTMSLNTGDNVASVTTATINVTGGDVTFGGNVTMANAATDATNGDQIANSVITITGGTVSVGGNINVTGSGTKNATLTLDGGSLDMTDGNIGAGGANGITFNARSGTLKNLNQLNGGADLTKTTTGLLVMEGANTYTGATLVNEGIVQVGVAGAGSAGAGGVTVASGATLAGTGSITGSTIIGDGAVLQAGDVTTPGTSSTTVTGNGTLNFTAAASSLTLSDAGEIRLGVTSADSIDGNFAAWFHANPGGTAADYVATLAGGLADTNWNDVPTGDHDFITAADTIILGSSATTDKRIVVTLNSPTGLTYGSVFNLLDWSTLGTKDGTALSGMGTGGFSVLENLQIDSLSGGLGWDTSLFNSSGILVVVPEPSRALLLMLGLLGLTLRHRRRQGFSGLTLPAMKS